jgi:CHAD domain-containing protein
MCENYLKLAYQNLSKDDCALVIFCNQISALINAVRLMLPNIAKDQDIEVLHQYRVSLRKVEALLIAFHNYVPKKILLDMQADIKALFAATGQLRDLDLLINKFQHTNLKENYTSSDKIFIQAIMSKRQDVFKQFLLSTQKSEYNERFVRLQACLIKVEQRRRQVTLNDCWPVIIKESKYNVHRAYQRLWKTKDDRHIHKLRKHLKQLRYCVELLGVLVKPRKAKLVLSWLKNQQASLGDYNDLQVQWGLLKEHDRANRKIKRVLKIVGGKKLKNALPLSKSDWKNLRKKIQFLAG